MNKLCLISLLILLLFCSCKRNDKIERLLEEWVNKKIIFPVSLETRILGRDTVCPDLFHNEFKLLVYIDSTGCTPCRLRLYAWSLFIQECEQISNNISFLFFINSKDYAVIDQQQVIDKFNYPMFYDRKNILDSLNHFPDESTYQTFLLDRENKIVLIGNPINNPIIGELIQTKIRERNIK